MRKNLADRVAVTGLECHERGVDDALVLARKFFGDDSPHLLDIEMENFADEAEDENVLALVLGGAAERFDGEASDRNADVNETFVVEIRLDVIRIVKQDAAFLKKIEVVLITVLVKRDEKVGFVAGRKDFARADADLENRRAAGNGGRNRHVGHDVLVAAAGEPREKRAGGLNAVLRIARESYNGVVDVLGTQIGALRRRCALRCARGLNLIITWSYRIAHDVQSAP